MERDYGKEIDNINMQLDEIKTLLMNFTQEKGIKAFKNSELMPGEHPNKPSSEKMEKLRKKITDDGHTGVIAYSTGDSADEQQPKWVNKEIDDKQLSKVMESLGKKTDADGNPGVIAFSMGDLADEQQPKWVNKEIDSDKQLSELWEELCHKAANDGSSGLVTYFGVHASGGHQSNWISNQVNVDKLLELIESNAAANVLTCIGNNDRLNLLLALLREPRTVVQLVKECGYNTTGQVYHHLKPLLAADLIKEDEHESRGRYIIQPHRVQGIIMLLAGISDMLDTKYTQGNWEE